MQSHGKDIIFSWVRRAAVPEAGRGEDLAWVLHVSRTHAGLAVVQRPLRPHPFQVYDTQLPECLAWGLGQDSASGSPGPLLAGKFPFTPRGMSFLVKKNQDYPSVLWGLNTSLQQQKFSFIVLLLKTCFYWALYYIFPLKIGESEPCGMADVSAGSGALQTGGQLSAHRTPPSPSEGAEWQGWPLPWCACFCWWSAHSCRLTIILFSFPSPV